MLGGRRHMFERDEQQRLKMMHDPSAETFKPMDPKLLRPDMQEKETMGTTICAAVYGNGPEDGGVVMAADGRTAVGGVMVVHRAANKLTKLTDRIYCCRAGTASDTQNLADLVSHYMRMHEITLDGPGCVESAARLFAMVVYYNRFNVSAGIIVAGWDPILGGQCFSVPMGAKIKCPYALSGSGGYLIYSFMDSTYRAGMTKDETRAWLTQGVAMAKSRDTHSGGSTRTIVINKEGTETQLIPWADSGFTVEMDDQFKELLPTKKPGRSSTVKDMY
eukprot:TRINITY_DN71020_c0_g1_i1.p1 TRINITY_DN71020_c0_g1~~TRINITY_DN71020_c0_g1_i1.p1  ORF type:complete len:301 (+),score=125.86 TRINITY_DN71020_c0_g1_i1:77-904(+)